MDDESNVFLQGTRVEATPRNQPYAVAAFGLAIATLVAIPLGFVHPLLTAPHLLFPAVLVLGHLALRRLKRDPGRWKGEGMAKFALAIGYFNVLVFVVVVAALVFGRSAAP